MSICFLRSPSNDHSPWVTNAPVLLPWGRSGSDLPRSHCFPRESASALKKALRVHWGDCTKVRILGSQHSGNVLFGMFLALTTGIAPNGDRSELSGSTREHSCRNDVARNLVFDEVT
ncbi:hypothetical protein MRX96_038750 [Rhipicephalus microplus]